MSFTLFAVIHEFAVLGTTFFLLALATLWYSPLLFGAMWTRAAGGHPTVFNEDTSGYGIQLGLTFLAYLIQVTLIAWLLAFAPSVGVTPAMLAGLLGLFAVSLTLPPVLYEAKSWQYFVVHSGFMVVFTGVSVASLTYWPW
jgi:hypothetical protein